MTIQVFIENLEKLFAEVSMLHEEYRKLDKKLEGFIDVAYRKRNEELGDLILKESDVEEILGVSSRWLRELRSRGEIDFIQLSDKKILYRQSFINQYLERKRIKKLDI